MKQIRLESTTDRLVEILHCVLGKAVKVFLGTHYIEVIIFILGLLCPGGRFSVYDQEPAHFENRHCDLAFMTGLGLVPF